MGIKSRTIIETGAREPLAGLGKHLDCALMNLFDKSSAVHRYSVRPSSPPKRLQPILFTLIIHPQQKKAIRQNSNLHSPLLRTNKFQVCAQISGQAAPRGQIQSLGPLEKNVQITQSEFFQARRHNRLKLRPSSVFIGKSIKSQSSSQKCLFCKIVADKK